MAVDTKHFDLPFRFDPITGHAAEVEQDTLEDVIDCVYMAYLVDPGYRIEVQSFGVPKQVFDWPMLDLNKMINAVYMWEPRATDVMDQVIDPNDQTMLAMRLHALVGLRSSSA